MPVVGGVRMHIYSLFARGQSKTAYARDPTVPPTRPVPSVSARKGPFQLHEGPFWPCMAHSESGAGHSQSGAEILVQCKEERTAQGPLYRSQIWFIDNPFSLIGRQPRASARGVWHRVSCKRDLYWTVSQKRVE